MSAFNVSREGRVIHVGFGDPATGDVVVRDARTALLELERRGELAGGGLLCINGRCSVPVAVALGHFLSHLFTAIAVFDPKLDRYIVCVSHDPGFTIGQLIDRTEV